MKCPNCKRQGKFEHHAKISGLMVNGELLTFSVNEDYFVCPDCDHEFSQYDIEDDEVCVS